MAKVTQIAGQNSFILAMTLDEALYACALTGMGSPEIAGVQMNGPSPFYALYTGLIDNCLTPEEKRTRQARYTSFTQYIRNHILNTRELCDDI